MATVYLGFALEIGAIAICDSLQRRDAGAYGRHGALEQADEGEGIGGVAPARRSSQAWCDQCGKRPMKLPHRLKSFTRYLHPDRDDLPIAEQRPARARVV